MTTGLQGYDTLYFDFDFIHSFSPGPELGLLHAAHHHQVFMVGPDSELEEEKEGEGEWKEYEDNYVWFQPDVGPEDEGPNKDEGHGVQLQDPRLTQAYHLDIEHQLDAIGTYRIAHHLMLVAVYQCIRRIEGVHSH